MPFLHDLHTLLLKHTDFPIEFMNRNSISLEAVLTGGGLRRPPMHYFSLKVDKTSVLLLRGCLMSGNHSLLLLKLPLCPEEVPLLCSQAGLFMGELFFQQPFANNGGAGIL
jgi:hypothetical protein